MRQHQETIRDILHTSVINLTDLSQNVSQLAQFFGAILDTLNEMVEYGIKRELLRRVNSRLSYNQYGELVGISTSTTFMKVC